MSYRVEFLELALLDLSSIVSHVANELGMPIAAYWVEETSKTVTVARILYNKRDVDSLL